MRHGARRYVDKVPNKAGALFVATTGNDANPGTFAQPFLTVQAAVTAATAGTTIYVRSGTYAEHVTIGGAGTATARITLRNYPGEAPVLNGGASSCIYCGAGHGYWTIYGLRGTSTGNSGSYAAGWGLFIEHDYTVEGPPGTWVYQDIPAWRVERCTTNCAMMMHGAGHHICYNTLDGTGNTDAAFDGAIMARAEVTTGLKIYGNRISNWKQRGVWLYDQVQDPYVWGNTIHDITLVDNSGMGIDLDGYGHHSDGGWIAYNHIYNVTGTGAAAIEFENAFTSPIAEGNIIHDCTYAFSVITYDEPTDVRGTACDGVVRNNVVYDCARFARISDAQDWDWFHNTCLDCTSDEAVYVEGTAAYLVNHVWKNNIIEGGNANGIAFSTPASLTWVNAADYNDWHTTLDKIIERRDTWASYDFEAWQGAGYDAHGISADPLFTNEASHVLTLQSGSPCKDTGTDAAVTTSAELNVTRPLGAGYDMGAYERA